MGKNSKSPGRTKGSPNEKNVYGRDERAWTFRATMWFLQVTDALVRSGLYKSRSDVYHNALAALALRHRIDDEKFIYWLDKIL